MGNEEDKLLDEELELMRLRLLCLFQLMDLTLFHLKVSVSRAVLSAASISLRFESCAVRAV